ncbi:hypothetical protein KIPE111705_41305 [Kibdelosporangium persicum]
MWWSKRHRRGTDRRLVPASRWPRATPPCRGCCPAGLRPRCGRRQAVSARTPTRPRRLWPTSGTRWRCPAPRWNTVRWSSAMATRCCVDSTAWWRVSPRRTSSKDLPLAGSWRSCSADRVRNDSAWAGNCPRPSRCSPKHSTSCARTWTGCSGVRCVMWCGATTRRCWARPFSCRPVCSRWRSHCSGCWGGGVCGLTSWWAIHWASWSPRMSPECCRWPTRRRWWWHVAG